MARTAQRTCAQRDASCCPSRSFAGRRDRPIRRDPASPSLGVELIPIDPRDPTEMERAITAFAREPNGGLILTGSQGVANHRNRIIALTLQYRLPNVYAFR